MKFGLQNIEIRKFPHTHEQSTNSQVFRLSARLHDCNPDTMININRTDISRFTMYLNVCLLAFLFLPNLKVPGEAKRTGITCIVINYNVIIITSKVYQLEKNERHH